MAARPVAAAMDDESPSASPLGRLRNLAIGCVVATIVLLGAGAAAVAWSSGLECHGPSCGNQGGALATMIVAIGLLVLCAFAAAASVAVVVQYARALKAGLGAPDAAPVAKGSRRAA